MPISEGRNNNADQLYTRVDDEQYADLVELSGQPLVHVSVWEETLADAIEEEEAPPPETVAVDLDLYLRDGVFFELYGVLCYTDIDEDPLAPIETIETTLQSLVRQEGALHEVAVDEEDALVLMLRAPSGQDVYLQVGAWVLNEWDELPEIDNS